MKFGRGGGGKECGELFDDFPINFAIARAKILQLTGVF